MTKTISSVKAIIALSVGLVVIGMMIWPIMHFSSEIERLRKTLGEQNLRISELQVKHAQRNETSQKLNEIEAEYARYKALFPGEFLQEDTIVQLRSLETDNDVKITKMSYNEMQLDMINQKIDDKTKEKIKNMKVAPPIEGLGMVMPVNISFTSNYEQMKSFLQALHDAHQKIGVHEVRAQLRKEEFVTNVKLDFYGIKPYPVKAGAAANQ